MWKTGGEYDGGTRDLNYKLDSFLKSGSVPLDGIHGENNVPRYENNNVLEYFDSEYGGYYAKIYDKNGDLKDKYIDVLERVDGKWVVTKEQDVLKKISAIIL